MQQQQNYRQTLQQQQLQRRQNALQAKNGLCGYANSLGVSLPSTDSVAHLHTLVVFIDAK